MGEFVGGFGLVFGVVMVLRMVLFGFKWDFVSGLYTWETARDFPSCSTAVRHQSTHDTSLAMFTIHHASRAESVFPVDIKRSSTNMGEHATQALNTHHLPLAA